MGTLIEIANCTRQKQQESKRDKNNSN